MAKPDFEELLEMLVNEFDTSNTQVFTYTTADGEEVEVSESTGLIIEQALLALYSGAEEYDRDPFYTDESE